MNINKTYTSVVSNNQNIQNNSQDKDQTVIKSTNDWVSRSDKMMKILDKKIPKDQRTK